ncbi:MAG: BatA domain-containing protein [Christensenellaceae bacterium]
MKLLTPLGLLGLLGLLVLLLIYLLKPNYQQKMVSSTYVWKRSLRYRKKTPISKLKYTDHYLSGSHPYGMRVYLAQPFIRRKFPEITEKAAVIDASAAMRVKGDQETVSTCVEQSKYFPRQPLKMTVS